jgi:putative DNA primase/helicase
MIPETSESKTWSRDDTLSAERHIKSTLLRVHPGVTQTTATSIEKWARETLNRPAEVWDKHPWLLAVQNGVINLQTGELHDGDPHLYLTRAAPFAYHPELNDADCPRWIKHQDMLFNGDADVIHTVHKMFGAALIGDATNIKPQAYLFIQGESGSGKGVELRMLAHVLGSFAENFKAADFEEKSNDRHHQWMTRLKGARLALVEEVPAGTLNVQLLKTLSGGDKQIANMMRQNDETWMPTHTLIFSSNLAPNFNNDIEGQLRRYVPLPTGPRRKPAAGYEQQLQDEAEAVLAWLVRGCRIWVEEDGGTFDPDTLPDSIKAVRDSHISDNDPYSPFIETNIIVTGDAADGFGRSALRIVFGKWLVERGDFKPLADKDPRLSRLADKLRTTPGVTEVPHIGSSRERGWRGVVWRDEVT